ncbi:RNA-binding family protein isoform 1 [Hibiscus syriacus]|uniref:RNA-binding family protein isoform 1 n=1 Tax=Hibiscus syriacus TaxID=106335 RepID=A0A6A3CKL9_HIBSY|nr:RNA-binding family protein isoform 1 [Hibiscus syriacus]
MPDRNIVSWSGMIDGYTRMNQHREAIGLFRRMVADDGVDPSEITLLGCVWFTEYTYAKCGCIVSALRFLEDISTATRDLVSWTSLISGFTMHGMGIEAVESFERMKQEGWKPNRVTFVSVLNTCSRGCMVEEGHKFFEKVVNEYRISPDIKHYGCLVDMLGRAWWLKEAEKISNEVVWRILLGACSFYGNVEMGDIEDNGHREELQR